jgi:hypothetical protein
MREIFVMGSFPLVSSAETVNVGLPATWYGIEDGTAMIVGRGPLKR